MLMIVFHIGEDRYAVNCQEVDRVVPAVPLKKIPRASIYMAGLLHEGNRLIPVVDGCQLLGERPSNICFHTRIIILKQGDRYLGFLAEKVTGTLKVTPEKFTGQQQLPYIGGAFAEESGMVRLLLTDGLFKELSHD